MVDPAHKKLLAAGTMDGRSDPQVTLHELSTGRLAEIASWPNRLEAVATSLAENCGLALPDRPGHFSARPGMILCWLSFGRFLRIAGEDEPALSLPAEDVAVVDLDSARHGFRLEGMHAANVLNKAAAIDFAFDAFPAGSLAQTTVHHIPLLILRRSEETFDLLAPSSLAEGFVDWLKDASLEYGYRVGPQGVLSNDYRVF